MGLLDRMLGRTKDRELDAGPAANTEYLPANVPDNALPSLRGRANAVVERAGRIYREHPKLIGGIATLAAAALLVRMKQGRRM